MPETSASPRVELRRVDDLVPYARNARTHSPEQISQIQASVLEFGWTNPILADAAGIVAGHGRTMAARALYAAGHTLRFPNGDPIQAGMVPVIDVTGWSEPKRRAYILADNKVAENAGWDLEMLQIELADLGAEGIDLSLTGFDDIEIAKMGGVGTEGLTDPDEIPEPPAQPIARLGDVWILGDHRIACGDSTDPETVARVLNGAKPHLMVTDPPYGVEYDPEWRNEVTRADGSKVSARATGKVLNDDNADWSATYALFPGDVAYIWCAPGPLNCVVHDSLVSAGFPPRMQIVWAKNQLVIGRGHYHAQHENCWYAVRKGRTGHWNGDRTQTTVWNIDKPRRSETGHGTQKPIECMKRPMENNSVTGDAIYEPFSGSGTSIIAGEMIGRRVHAIELNPAYVDVAVKRWMEFTGRQAVLESTGQSFAEAEAERVPAEA